MLVEACRALGLCETLGASSMYQVCSKSGNGNRSEPRHLQQQKRRATQVHEDGCEAVFVVKENPNLHNSQS